MLTESKTEIPLKNGATLRRVHTSVSTIDDVADVDDAKVIKAEKLNEDKIVEQTIALTEHDDEIEEVG